MKIITTILVLLVTSGVYSQWIAQEFPNLNNVNAIQAVNSNVVFAAGKQIYKTTNSGTNWQVLTNLAYEESRSDISFINSATGWSCGPAGSVYRTTNGGLNWVENFAGSESLSGIDFLDANTGFVCGAIGRLYKTTDGGQNWTARNPGTSGWLKCVYFYNSSTGWITGDDGSAGIIKKTTNGGDSWVTSLSGTHNYVNDIDFLNSNTGFASGYGKIFRTTDGGTNWDTCAVSGNVFWDFQSINVLNSQIVFATGTIDYSACILKSYDGGLTFYKQMNGGNNEYNDITFAPGSLTKGWVGSNSGIRFTTNGGGELIGIEQTSNTIPSDFELKQNYPNPFNPSTNIRFSLPAAGSVKLVVYDISGRQVAELVNKYLTAGSYSFDFNASKISSGTYFYRLETNDYTETKKMILIK